MYAGAGFMELSEGLLPFSGRGRCPYGLGRLVIVRSEETWENLLVTTSSIQRLKHPERLSDLQDEEHDPSSRDQV